MSGLLVFGVDVEKTYGTAYYFAINVGLIIVSSILSLGFYAFMAFCIPVIYRGGP
jgi:membrane associated rhomboid family serine protease